MKRGCGKLVICWHWLHVQPQVPPVICGQRWPKTGSSHVTPGLPFPTASQVLHMISSEAAGERERRVHWRLKGPAVPSNSPTNDHCSLGGNNPFIIRGCWEKSSHCPKNKRLNLSLGFFFCLLNGAKLPGVWIYYKFYLLSKEIWKKVVLFPLWLQRAACGISLSSPTRDWTCVPCTGHAES